MGPLEAGRRRVRPDTYLFFLVLFALIALLTHAAFLTLPFFWDELGQFIPAALDIYNQGAWIPLSTTPNVHPPGVMAYLAAFWRVAGYSVISTRVAMLLVSAAALLAVFLLAIRLNRTMQGVPALVSVALLCISPLFFAQSMLAQLDMPAMLFTALALLLFLQERWRAAVAACTALVLVKETGAVVPLVFAAWLWRERRHHEAFAFLFPLGVVALWITVLAGATGHLFGNSEFTRYNVIYPLHPVRIAVALVRRLFQLLIENFHWAGALAIFTAWRRTRVFASRDWKIAATIALAHVVMLSLLGGAALERYLLPVLPIFYIAAAAATTAFTRGWRFIVQGSLAAGLIAGNFWNPPYPFPLENNLAFTDFVRLHQDAARFLSRQYPHLKIATAWPLAQALRRKEWGYVDAGLRVRELPDFRASAVRSLNWSDIDVFVLYSRSWQPRWNIMEAPPLRELRARYFGYESDISPRELSGLARLELAGRWSRRGQWLEVWVKAGKMM